MTTAGGGGEDPTPAREGRLERRIWIVGYVAILLVLAVGAARRIAAMF